MDRRWQLAAFALAVALVPQEGMAQGGGWVDPPATGAPAPRRVETNPTVETPPAPPPAQPAALPPAPTAQPARPPSPEPDVATRPEPARPAEPQRQQARPEAPEPPRQQARPEPAEPPRQQQARPEPVEPPRAPRPPAPREPAVAERPAANLGQAAQRLALDYLGFWSASNDDTLDGMPDFYGSRVEFHGRSMSARALFEEKRRFVRRWPERSYSPRGDTMRVSCAPAGEVCTVRTQFDFYAANPQTGRRSAGTGQLELVVALAGPNPVIVSERSQVVRRGSLVTTEEVDED